MKLVLQIAGGILLASIIAGASVATYRWASASLTAEAQERDESNAAAQLRGLTIEKIRASCAPVLGEGDVAGLPASWRTLVFEDASITLDGQGDDIHIDWVKTPTGAVAYKSVDQLRLLPCLGRMAEVKHTAAKLAGATAAK